MGNVVFPKKVLYGNFENDLISTRSTGFESLLKHISQESRLRNSNAMLIFLMDVEMSQVKALLEKKEFEHVYPLLEGCFKLLNKVRYSTFFDQNDSISLSFNDQKFYYLPLFIFMSTFNWTICSILFRCWETSVI